MVCVDGYTKATYYLSRYEFDTGLHFSFHPITIDALLIRFDGHLSAGFGFEIDLDVSFKHQHNIPLGQEIPIFGEPVKILDWDFTVGFTLALNLTYAMDLHARVGLKKGIDVVYPFFLEYDIKKANSLRFKTYNETKSHRNETAVSVVVQGELDIGLSIGLKFSLGSIFQAQVAVIPYLALAFEARYPSFQGFEVSFGWVIITATLDLFTASMTLISCFFVLYQPQDAHYVSCSRLELAIGAARCSFKTRSTDL